MATKEEMEQVVGDELYGEYMNWSKNSLVADIVKKHLKLMSSKNLKKVYITILAGYGGRKYYVK